MWVRQLALVVIVGSGALAGCRGAHSGFEDTGWTQDAEWITLGDQCVASAGEEEDPLQRVGEVFFEQQQAGFLCELLQVTLDSDRQVAYSVGQGGVLSFDISDVESPEFTGRYGGKGRYYQVAVGAEDTVYVTHRDFGLEILDVSNLSAIQKVGDVAGDRFEGLAVSGDWLYVVSLGGDLVTFDVSSPRALNQVSVVDGLSSARIIAVDGEVAYVADGTLGLVPVDLSTPNAPVVLDAVASVAGAQDVVIGDGVVYSAVGGAGIEIFDSSAPLSPISLGTLDLSASVIGLALDGDDLWAVSHESVVVLDVSTPTAPAIISVDETTQWSMQVAATGGTAFLAEWGYFSAYSLSGDDAVSHLELSTDEVYFSPDGSTQSVRLQNLGAAPLLLTGAKVWSGGGEDGADMSEVEARVQVRVNSDLLVSGGVADLELRYSGGEDLEATLCLESSTSDGGRTYAALTVGELGAGAALGNEAADFVLEDLDGNSHRLSEQLGHPVVLVYFATW